ncbi:MAG: hypothetical protein M3Y32_07195, partial [Pseudomonadota bacterium]|nr:hypothetical protein [Pseudomonadota bacterium]
MRTPRSLPLPSALARPAGKRSGESRSALRPNLLSLAAAALLGPLSVAPASALVCVWNPATGNWGTGSDWSCSVVPTAGNADTATIGAGKVVTVNDLQSPGTFRSTRFLNNAGTLNLDAFGLTLGGGGATVNSGTIQVGGASTAALQVSAGHNIDNSGGAINIGAGSVLNQFGSSISGGTITTAGTGMLAVFSSSGNILSGVSFNGAIDMATNANSRQRIGNGMTLNGSIAIANGGILSLDSTAVANQTINGSATFNLNDAGARLAIEGNGSTTLGANVVVRGQGNVGQAAFTGGTNTLINNGRISADAGGGTLSLTPPAGSGSVINNNLLDARNGGTLVISTTVDNSSGQINAQTGSTVVQAGASIKGGTLGTSGSGVIQVNSSGSNFLDGVTLSGVLDMSGIANARNRIINSTTINGAVNVGNGGILSIDGTASSGGNVLLNGTGVINLTDAGARLAVEGNGTSTLGSGLTVRGQGSIGQANVAGGSNLLTNNGLISADVNGGTLNIVPPANSGSFVNNGTLQAVS